MSRQDTYPEEYKFLEIIKALETWVLITKFHGPWYHECGDYFQVELDGLAIDGCASLYRCTIHLTADGNERDKAEQFPTVYAPGTLFHMKASDYNILDREVRFYRYEMKPVPAEYNGTAIIEWMELSAMREGLIEKIDT